MLDTGAEPNIIKRDYINEYDKINQKEIILLAGITDDEVSTLGSVIIYIINTLVTFHVVPNDFPTVT